MRAPKAQAKANIRAARESAGADAAAATTVAAAAAAGSSAASAAAAPAAPVAPPAWLSEQSRMVQEELDAQDRVRAVQEQQVWNYQYQQYWDPPWVKMAAYPTTQFLACRYPAALATAAATAAAAADAETNARWQEAWELWQQQDTAAKQEQEQKLLRQLSGLQ